MRVSAKTQSVNARAAIGETPVNLKTMSSSAGQTGSATAGLKSPLQYQWPEREWRVAASPDQTPSGYLAQSIQGELLGKCALRWKKCRTKKTAATASRSRAGRCRRKACL